MSSPLPFRSSLEAYESQADQLLDRWTAGDEQAIELFGGAGVVAGMPIEKYVRDAHVQKHVSFPFPSRFKITEALAGYQRKVPPSHGGD